MKRSTTVTAVAPTTFDFNSAQEVDGLLPLQYHQFYRDAAGSACLVVLCRLQDGKATIRDLAIERLDQMPGDHFIRLIDKVGKTDVIFPRFSGFWDCALVSVRIPENAQDLT